MTAIQETEPAVVAAKAKTPVFAMVELAIAAGDLAHQRDCVGLAHKLQSKHRETDSQSYRLEAEMLDHALTQAPQSMLDVALLCAVAWERSSVLDDALEEPVKTVADAISTALMTVCGFAVSNLNANERALIPDRLREFATGQLGNIIGNVKAHEAFSGPVS